MKEFVHFKTSLIQKLTENEDFPHENSSQETNARLKLIVSNPEPRQEMLLPQNANFTARASFTAEVCVKGPYLYEMTLQDPSHYLTCNLYLEVEESNRDYEGRSVICYFPAVSDRKLRDFIEEEEILYGALMAQFYMKILKQLFIFCATHYASTLVIFADGDQADDLGIYRDFLTHEDQTIILTGGKIEMIISTNQEAFEAWMGFMQKAAVDFQQTLWREQRDNPIIRRYLKMQCSRGGTHGGLKMGNSPC